MATLREIRRRIKSIRNIAKVTRAMEMVAASKMRRSQMAVVALRPYASKAREVLIHLAAQRGAGEEMHPLLKHRPVISRIGLVLVTSNRGLCGGYNHNILRLADDYLEKAPAPVDLITVGRVGRNAMTRARRSIIADFEKMPDQPALSDVTPLARVVMDDFLNGTFDQVDVIYTDFVNTMLQVPTVRPLLPLRHEAEEEIFNAGRDEARRPLIEYVYEPGPAELLNVVLPRFIELQLYQMLLEAKASEHSARMVAMRAATDNAQELVGSLILRYNQARQAAITKEMLEIVGGANALAQARQRAAG